MRISTRFQRTLTGLAMGAAFLAASPQTWGQSSTQIRFRPLSMTQSAGTYTAVSGSATIITLPDNDEGLSSAQPVGFTFPFNGKSITHFILSSNGWIKLGTSAGMAAPSGPLYGGLALTQNDVNSAILSLEPEDENIVSAFNIDLMDGLTPAIDAFSYEVTGTAPNRVCTIQFKNRKDYRAAAQVNNSIFSNINFQIKLNENGQIAMVYGAFSAGPAPNTASAGFVSAAVGIKNSSVAVADDQPEQQSVIVKGSTGAWNAVANALYYMTQASGTASQGLNVRMRNAADQLVNPALAPVSGQTYTWTPYTPMPTQLTYSPITVANDPGTYTAVTGGTTITTANFDAANSTEQAIGFNFNFSGQIMTHFILNTDGYMKLGTTGMTAPATGLFPPASGLPGAGVGPLYNTSTTLTTNILAPMAMNLIGGVGAQYVYSVTGTPGNRICTIEWAHVRDAISATGADGGANVQLYTDMNFQVKLYESNATIEYVYGSFTATGTNDRKQVGIGMKGLVDLPSQILVANTSTDGSFAGVTWSRTWYNNYAFYNAFLMGNTPARLPDAGRKFTFPLTYANDLRADIIYTLGKLPTPTGTPTEIRGVLRNVGVNDYPGGGTATLNLTGANTGSGSAPVPAIPAGGTAEVSFGNFSPTNIGATVVVMNAPSDDNNGNISRTWTMDVNTNTYSYKNAAQANAGGVGFTGATGVFVAKFSSSSTNTLNSVKVDFAAPGGRQYQLMVYADNAGVPGSLRYISPVYTSPIGGGQATLAICPSLSVAGDFYVGVRQFQTTNVGFSYQTENPIRSGTFFYTSPVANGGAAVNDASTGWQDFAATASPFRFSIEALLETAPTVPNCATLTGPADGSVFQSRNVTLSWGAGAGPSTASYDVYFSTNPTFPGGPVLSNYCGNTYTPATLATNATYYWRIVPRNLNGPATGCATWSFTTAPLPGNDECTQAIRVMPCTPAITRWTNNATKSVNDSCEAGASPNDDVWFYFIAESVTHRITVTPVDAAFDGVIDVRSGCPGTILVCSNLRPAGFNEAVNVTGLTVGNTYAIRVYSAGNLGTEGRFTIGITTDGGWTGATSTAWSEPTNWCDGTVPVATTAAQIRLAANQPILGANATVLNLAVDAGATLTLDPGVVLSVRNDGSAGGTFSGDGTVTGGTLRLTTLGGGQTVNSTATIDNLQVANTAGVTIQAGSALKIKQGLTYFSSTTLNNNGNIAFLSDASSTGRFGSVVGSYNGTGTFTTERYIDGSARWVFVGAPVQDATIAQWSEVRPTLVPLNNASLFWFQETDSSRTMANGAVAERNGWRVPTSTSSQINLGGVRGYRAYVRSDFLGGSSPKFAVTGTPYTGNVPVTLTRTLGQYYNGGYNMIANPYASDIDWDAVTRGGGVNNAFFIYNGVARNYQVYVGSGGNSEGVALNSPGPNPGYIASSQGFFVRTAINNSTVTFTEAAKVAGNRAFQRTGAIVDRLRITMRDAAGNSDEAVVRFRDGATEALDIEMDAGSMGADYVSVSTVNPGTETLDVNSLPLLQGRKSVWVSANAFRGVGTYALDFSEVETFDPAIDVLLVDHLLGATVNLRQQASYVYQVTGNPASTGTTRFELLFNDTRVMAVKPTLAGAALSAWPNPATGSQQVLVGVSGNLSGKATLEVVDATGRTVHTQALNLSGNAMDAYPVSASLPAGAYTVRCVNAASVLSTRLIVNK